MRTSKISASEPLDWKAPWCIERPAQARAPAGPERKAQLEHKLLFRSRRALKAILDQIDPAIALNEPVSTIDEETVANALLEFLEPDATRDGSAAKKKRISLHKARVFLLYFVRGFRAYCQEHGLRQPRLPLIRELSLDEGSLRTNLFESLRHYRRAVDCLVNAIGRDVLSSRVTALQPVDIATLLVCSSALLGGLERHDHWEAFVAKLGLPLERAGELFSFRFDHPSTFRWIADPVTEALLRRLWHHGLLPLPGATKSSPLLIKKLLELQTPTRDAVSHLEGLVRAAHLRHFAPDVAAVAQGLIPNTSLMEEPWLRLISGTRHPAPRRKISTSVPRVQPAVQAETLEQVAIQEVVDDISHAVRWDPKALRKTGTESSREGQSVGAYFSRARVALRASEGKLEQIYARSGYREAHHRTFAFGLLCYARDLLELGGLRVRQLAPSTIDSYVGIVRNQLAKLRFTDLVAIGTERREDAYRTAIRSQLARERAIHRTAFEGFERSLLRHMDLIDEVDWATIPGRARGRHLPNVDANLIDPTLYRHVFDSLAIPAKNSAIGEFARALLVILYRFGLRTGEAAEVTAGALTLHADKRMSVRVSRSVLTSRKSGNALRRIGPISLPDDEREFLIEYRDRSVDDAARRGRDRAGTYLFAANGADSLEYVESAQKLLIEVLRAASGDPNLRLRHLRHTFVSRSFLTGRDPLDWLDPVTPEATCDAWWRTFASGHGAPDTGIASYTHVVELAHYHYVCKMLAAEVPLSFLSRLSGNDARTLERAQLRQALDDIAAMAQYRKSLRRNFPCTDIPDTLARRSPYSTVVLTHTPEPISTKAQRLDWERAWEVYAAARIGRTTNDVSEHAQSIRARVRKLEVAVKLKRRLKRRPQLEPDEAAAAAALWLSLLRDDALRGLFGSAAEWLRPRGGQLLLPAAMCRDLELHLRRSGLERINSRSGNSQRRWLEKENEDGTMGTAWIELLAFLYAGMT